MLAFALAIAVLAYVAVGVGHAKKFPPSVAGYAAGFAALMLAAHLVVRWVAPYADPLFLPMVLALNTIGLVVIHRLDLADIDRARQQHKAIPTGDAGMQLIWTALGMACFVVVLLVLRDHRIMQRYAYTAMALGLLLLLVPAVLPAGHSEVNGAKIWIRVGGLSFQPGEIAKILLMVFFAGYFVAKRDVLTLASRRVLAIDLPRGRDMGPVLVAWAVTLAVLVLEHDLGTSLLFFGIFLAMLYVATQRVSWVLIGFVLFVGGSMAAYELFGHVQERVDIWLHPWSQAQGNAYQLVQGLFGLANGGITGTGLGLGRPDLVPYAKTDFIVATLGEELGLAGLMAILVMYGLLVERGLRTSVLVRDSFGKLLAAGLAFALALQVFVVVGGVTRLIPLTGMTMPFLSYGGSSLIANWILVALLIRISDAARRPTPPVTRRAPRIEDATTQVVRP
ncbi:MAG: FtsW/RodA/SpoVE family cell cycle protein [Frankiaceae bacterium]